MTLDELFEREPTQWGLRGDPHVWREMRAALRGKPLPDSHADARQLLTRTFTKIVGIEPSGHPGEPADVVYLKKFAVGSGMSDGKVSVAFWRDTAIPILLDRYVAAREVADPGDRFGLS